MAPVRQPRTAPRRSVLLIAVSAGLVVAVVVAFLVRGGSSDEPAAGTERAAASALQFLPGDAVMAYDGLCKALGQAVAGAPGDARFTFYAEAHEGLHSLLSALQVIDEPAAARYEQVKNEFETTIGYHFQGVDPVPSLRGLIEATADGIESFGAPRPAPCP